MFTGIITHLGTFQKKEKAVFTFATEKQFITQLKAGTSVSVNGVCLTVLKKPIGNTFSVEIMPETERKTNLHYLRENDLVNLELPATSETFLSGHIVQGHIDGVEKILAIKPEGNSYLFTFSLANSLSKYLVKKGSITINGISLTVIALKKDSFTVGIIPHTWENTMLYKIKKGEYVNIETDVLAKYVERLLRKNI